MKVVSKKEIDEIMRLKDVELLSFQDIGKQLNLGADTVSRFYNEETIKKKKEVEEVKKADLTALEKREKPYKTLATNKTVAFDPSALAVIEQLKQKKIFNDMDEAVNKALEMMAAQTNNPKYVDFLTKGGAIQMPEPEPNPEKEIKKVQAQEIADVYLAKKKAEVDALTKKVEEGKAQPNSIMPLLQEQLAMKQMKSIIKEMNGEDKGTSANPLKEMKDMVMMNVYSNMMMGGNNNKGNGELLQLQRKIEELQGDIKDSKMLSAVQKIAEGSKNQSMNADDYLKFFADKQEAVEKQKIEVEKARQETQKERDARIEEQNTRSLETTNRQIQELQAKLEEKKKEGSGIEELTKLKGHISTLKEVAKEFGVQQKEKSTGEIAADLVLGVAEKLKDPISHATKGFADKMATEKMRAQGPVYTNIPPAPAPTPLNPEPDVSAVHPETTTDASQAAPESAPETPADASQSAPESAPEPSTDVESAGQDIVNTFAGQNTAKKSTTEKASG